MVLVFYVHAPVEALKLCKFSVICFLVDSVGNGVSIHISFSHCCVDSIRVGSELLSVKLENTTSGLHQRDPSAQVSVVQTSSSFKASTPDRNS